MKRSSHPPGSHRYPAYAVGLLTLAVFVAVRFAIAAPPQKPDSKQIADFSLTDVAGHQHTPAEWQQSKAVLLYFLGTECPVSNGYSPLMQDLATRYARRGVACYGVHSDPSVSAAAATRHADEYRLTFTILLDPEQVLARMAGAQVTPDVVVASPDGKVLYRGRIDDRYALDGKRRDVPTTHELVDALDAVLAGKAPPTSEAKAYGCPLPKLRKPKR